MKQRGQFVVIFTTLALTVMLFQNCGEIRGAGSDGASLAQNGNGDYYQGEQLIAFKGACGVVGQLSEAPTSDTVIFSPTASGRTLTYEIKLAHQGIERAFQIQTQIGGSTGGGGGIVTQGSSAAIIDPAIPLDPDTPKVKLSGQIVPGENFDLTFDFSPQADELHDGHLKVSIPVQPIDSPVRCRIQKILIEIH